jgi:hypothetical protein
MTTPTDPTKSTPSSFPSQSASQQPSQLPTSYVDPTGAWAAFLSTPGHSATAKDVQMFMNGLLKFFNVLIQQQQDSFKRTIEELKKAEKGEE